MSVKYSPQDRIVVTNFRYNPSSSISIFDNSQVGVTKDTAIDGGALVWDAASGQFITKLLASDGGTYDDSGKQGLTDLTIRYSNTADVPLALAQGELAYSFLPDSFDSTTGKMAGGETLYIGSANGEPVAIASQRTYDLLNHKDGITVANSALIVGANKEVDQLTIGSIAISGSTLNVLNPFSDLILNPGGNANINASGHRITNVKDPVAPQDAVTKNYVDTALANYQMAPVTIADRAPAGPQNGDLWYDSDDTYRLYVYDAGTRNWVDASPSIQGSKAGLVIIANNAPSSPEVGQAWYDQDTTGRTFVWDGVHWVDMNPQQNQAETQHSTIALTAPANPREGDLWYNSNTAVESMYVWSTAAAAWLEVSSKQEPVTHVTVSDTAPVAPIQGDIWYDSKETYRSYVWDDPTNAWIDMSPSNSKATGLLVIANTAPANPEIGQAWYDSGSTGRTFGWDGVQWVDISPDVSGTEEQPPFVVSAVAPAAEVGAAWWDIANNQGYVYDGTDWKLINENDFSVVLANTAPTAEIGDLWYDTANTARTYVWDGAQWLDVAPQANVVYQPLVIIDNLPPTLPEIGQAWYDADNTGRTYVWDGIQWVDMNPQAAIPPQEPPFTIAPIAPTGAAVGDAYFNTVEKAGYVWDGAGWVRVVPETTAHSVIADTPPSNPEQGDLWYDSASTYRMYVWDSTVTSWIDVSPDLGNTSNTNPLVLIANTAPATPVVGTAWYDADDTGRTYVWDGTQWVDIAPQQLPLQEEEFFLLENDNLSFNQVGLTVSLVGDYKRFVVEVVDCKLNIMNASSGWDIDLTTANRTVLAYSAFNTDNTNSFTHVYSFNNYVDNGLIKPSTFLLNKYNEKVLSLTIKPNNPADLFIDGILRVWGIR